MSTTVALAQSVYKIIILVDAISPFFRRVRIVVKSAF